MGDGMAGAGVPFYIFPRLYLHNYKRGLALGQETICYFNGCRCRRTQTGVAPFYFKFMGIKTTIYGNTGEDPVHINKLH